MEKLELIINSQELIEIIYGENYFIKKLNEYEINIEKIKSSGLSDEFIIELSSNNSEDLINFKNFYYGEE